MEWARPTLLAMAMDISKEELERMIAEIIEDAGFEFVEMKLARHGKHHALRVFADRQGGINLDQCGMLSRTLGRKLDEIDPFDHSYTLEVSSPGLDRPLTTINDFRRRIGENVRTQLRDPIEKKLQIEGRLTGVTDDTLVFETRHGTIELPIDQVKSGKIVF
jgi:ribosome maturation factor RimP